MMIYMQRGRLAGVAGTTVALDLTPAVGGRRLKLDYLYTSAVSTGAAINSTQIDFGSAAFIAAPTVGTSFPFKHRSGYVAGAANIPCSVELNWPNGNGPELPQGVTDPRILVTFSAANLDGNVCVGYHYE